MTETYRFRGVDGHGVQRSGRVTAPDGLAAMVEGWFRQGWRYLVVCAGDGPVPPSFADQCQAAGITRETGTGKRTWWAEDTS